jgi:hypothetical protein
LEGERLPAVVDANDPRAELMEHCEHRAVVEAA